MKGNIFIRFPGGRSKALTFSYDDGVQQDIRLAGIFKKYRMKATFNINSGTLGSTSGNRLTPEQVEVLYTPDLFEVACHTYTHPFLEKCDSAVALSEVLYDRREIEKLFGREAHGMAYPYGTYSDEVIDICRTAGIYYSRTTQSHTTFQLPSEWLTWHPTCHHTNPKLFELADKMLSSEPGVRQDPWLFYVWGHSYEFDRHNNWARIEEFCEKMSGKDDIWYATNMDIYRYCRSFSRLKYSADGKIIYNPTADELWFTEADGKMYSIKPGETVKR